MKDYTTGVTELREHYNALKIAKKTIRAQVKIEFEAKIDLEIQSRIEKAELEFAQHLRQVKERDNIPVTVIQDNVLRSRSWNRWVEIRDLGEIQPEMVSAENLRDAKRIANSPFVWSEDNDTLTVKRNSKGEEIDPVEFDIRTNAWVKSVNRWWPDSMPGGISEAESAAIKGDSGFSQFVSDEIERHLKLERPE